jgi:sugar/nucleoside kinase (ribokinase family)
MNLVELANQRNTPSVVIVGHVCLDIIPRWDGAQREMHKAITPGAMLNIGPADLALGGAVLNTGIALHRLGARTRLVGKVGDDPFGHLVRELLDDIDPALHDGMVVARGENTSYTIVISPPNTDRTFLHHSGANDRFGSADIVPDQLAGARLMHFGYPPLMRRIYSDGGRELSHIFRLAKSMGLTTSLDMTQIDRRSDAARVNWPALLATVLPHVDVFLPSIDEIRFMLGDESAADAGACGEDLHRISSRLLEMGSAIIALKLGDEGLYLRSTPDRKRLASMGGCAPPDWQAWAGRQIIAPCFAVDVAGTTGAGDCTIAGFLGGLLRGLGPEETVTAAVATGACCVEAADATSGVPDWETLQRRIAAGWPRKATGLLLPGWQWDASRTIGHGPADGTVPAASLSSETYSF